MGQLAIGEKNAQPILKWKIAKTKSIIASR
jgi:hypothetical protein